MATTDFQSMRKAFEARWWPLPDYQTLGRFYLERKMQPVEINEPWAEELTEVVNVEQDQPTKMTAEFEPSGGLQVVRGEARVDMPQTETQLKNRLMQMGTAWMMAGFVHSNWAWLKGLTPQLFTEYVDYFLGRDVFGLEIENDHGHVIAGPSLRQLLNEYAICEETMRLVRSHSVPLAQGLRDIWKKPSLKEVNFTAPTSLTNAA